jgi:hypothetical protein
MNTKLTLTIEESIIEKAKSYAIKRKRSLSNIIESYLISITREETSEKTELMPIVKSLKGSFTDPENFDYKEELTDRLSKKYL